MSKIINLEKYKLKQIEKLTKKLEDLEKWMDKYKSDNNKSNI